MHYPVIHPQAKAEVKLIISAFWVHPFPVFRCPWISKVLTASPGDNDRRAWLHMAVDRLGFYLESGLDVPEPVSKQDAIRVTRCLRF